MAKVVKLKTKTTPKKTKTTPKKPKSKSRPQPVRIERIIPANPGFEQLIYVLNLEGHDDTVVRYPVIAWQQDDDDGLWQPVAPGMLDERACEMPTWYWGIQRPDGRVQDEWMGDLFNDVAAWMEYVRANAAERQREADERGKEAA
jgi:hypothetical protein